MTLPFDYTHDLDIGVSRSESEIPFSQEWGGRLTMNEKDVSHPFMTMILTCVAMVRWADVPDSDWGDFRRRCAVDISSLIRVSETKTLTHFSDTGYTVFQIYILYTIFVIDTAIHLWAIVLGIA